MPNLSAWAGSPSADTHTKILAATEISEALKKATAVLSFLTNIVSPYYIL
tara:strand:- start:1044 stop:1193 length:150 start_codon:yes stop_codon:yes gene_type:complete